MASSISWRAASALVGAFLASCVPHLLPQHMSVRAAWCWDSKPPWCEAPVVTDGFCTEGKTIAAGQKCTPNCTKGKVPSGSCTVECPPSGGTGCTDDITAKTWWDPCGYGNVCLYPIELGKSKWSRFGSFECVADTGKKEGCAVVAKQEIVDVTKNWGLATILFFVGLIVITVIGILLGMLPAYGKYSLAPLWPMFRKRGKTGMSFASMLTVLAVIGGLVAYIAGLFGTHADLLAKTHKVKILGLAAGVSCSLPVWWAFFKGGVNTLFGVSREAAWRIHIVLGWIAIILGGVHGIHIMAATKKNVSDSVWWILGLVGWLLMLIGVLPSDVYLFKPKLMRYDIFKSLHFLSVIGFFLAIMHMADHALKVKSAESWTVFLVNALAAFFMVVQIIFLKAVQGKRVSVEAVEVSNEACGQHIFLHLKASSFSFKAGQWARLYVPSVGLVPHPFTIVPARPDASAGVQFFIKVSGKFTEGLAKACERGASGAPKMILEGPYGIPAVPEPAATQAVVFVLGGVGVTPALSLVAEAVKAHRETVYLFWSCRSPALIARSVEFFKMMDVSKRIICLSGGSSEMTDNNVAGLCTEKKDVSGWIKDTEEELARAGVSKATLFCCGPAGLCDRAVSAALSVTSVVKFHIHVEEFAFLPSVSAPRCKTGASEESHKKMKENPTTIGASGS